MNNSPAGKATQERVFQLGAMAAQDQLNTKPLINLLSKKKEKKTAKGSSKIRWWCFFFLTETFNLLLFTLLKKSFLLRTKF